MLVIYGQYTATNIKRGKPRETCGYSVQMIDYTLLNANYTILNREYKRDFLSIPRRA